MRKHVKLKNVVINLQNREYRQKPHARYDYRIVRSLICEGYYVYKKVWEKHSNKSISCEGGKIYFENYSICYGGYTLDCSPKCLYTLHMSNGVKIEDAIITSTQPESIPQPYHGHIESIICLTNNNWLIRYDLMTGRTLQEVYLSPRYNFRNIAWNNHNESFVVKSTHNRMSNLARQSVKYQICPPILYNFVLSFFLKESGLSVPIMMVLAVFQVYPLQFTCMVEVNRNIFGKDIIDATISQGFLITMHQSSALKMYSFEYIIEKYRRNTPHLYKEMDDLGHTCGHTPIGVPCNVHVSECPPVLFEVKCADHIIEIGGTPWHYLICPPKCRGYFNVLSLESKTLADNGILDAENLSIEPDRAIFCPDESGRILHIGATEIRVLKICEEDQGRSRVKECFTINMERSMKSITNNHIPVTSSGRNVKRKMSIDEVTDCQNLTIHNVDYEIDLDLLCVSAVYHDPEATSGILRLYDSHSNHLYKEVKLEEPYLEFYEHNVYIDVDTVIQVIKPTPSKFICIVYRLCAINDNETKKEHVNSDTRQSRRSSHSVSRRRRTR